ncbi:hypothetical protein CEXT_322011 [Caerostris extrusa]|uniref:Uncharacterized protein n=1 Tax=Caerostris extrusa TaxID=172846 RepID=A0AAV4NLG2_CAEEX|nr:hypothetical protein CEXT_322011 [Caerostris extrusa]
MIGPVNSPPQASYKMGLSGKRRSVRLVKFMGAYGLRAQVSSEPAFEGFRWGDCFSLLQQLLRPLRYYI